MKYLPNKMIQTIVIALGLIVLSAACTREQAQDIRENLVSRLSLNLNLVPALTSIFSRGFNNRGSGFDLPGSPAGDSVISYNSRGSEPSSQFSMFFLNNTPSNPTTRIRGLNTIRHQNISESPNDYTVWRPIELNVAPRRTSVIMSISVTSTSRVNIIFANSQASLRNRFETSEDDIAVISISEGAIWARKLGVSLRRGGSSERLGDFYSPLPTSLQSLQSLTLTFNTETNTCTLILDSTINQNLNSEYCNPSDTSKMVVGMRIFKAFNSPDYGISPSYSLGAINVLSLK